MINNIQLRDDKEGNDKNKNFDKYTTVSLNVHYGLLANITDKSENMTLCSGIATSGESHKTHSLDLVTIKDAFMISNQNMERSKIMEIGKKTRKRLQEVKSRRKEIVCLDDMRLTESIFSTSKCENTTVKKISKKKLNEDIIGTSMMSTNSSNHVDRSNIVRISNISPIITPDQIRFFFGGLSPVRIFFLPRYDKSVSELGDHDEKYDHSVENKSNRKWERRIRVFVKFTSKIVAELACCRSGESIRLRNDDKTYSKDNINIEVCHVPKYIAFFIERYMAIDFVNGETIGNRLSHADKVLHNIVTKILWVMAEIRLKWSSKIEFLNFKSISIQVHKLKFLNIPLDMMEYRNLVDLYNKIWIFHKNVEEEHNNSLIDDWYSFFTLNNCFYKLYVVASNWLLDQLERVKCSILSFKLTNGL